MARETRLTGPDAPAPDPSKKYWWIAGVAVPIVVALIGFIASHQKPNVVPAQPTPLLLNPSGTVWAGTLTFEKGAQAPVRIIFAADGTALSYYGTVLSGSSYELIDHCRWTGVAGVVRIDCTIQTTTKWPNPGYSWMQTDSSYNLKIEGSSLTGRRDESNPVDIHSVVNMKRLQ